MVTSRHVLALCAAVLASGTLAAAASGAAVKIGRGKDAASIVRSANVRVLEQTWSGGEVIGSKRPRLAALWIEQSRIPSRRDRFRWDTYLAWCRAGRCEAPTRLRRQIVSKADLEPTSAQYAWVDASEDEGRVFLRYGLREGGPRWALVTHGRRQPIMTGPAVSWYYGGEASYARTADGRDLVAWSDGEIARLMPLHNGARMGGEAFAQPADSVRLARFGGGVSAIWVSRSGAFDEGGPISNGPAIWSSGRTAAELGDTSHQVTLAAQGGPGALINIAGNGPQLTLWGDGSGGRAAWTGWGGRPDPAAAVAFIPPDPTFGTLLGFERLRVVVGKDGSLSLCSVRLFATALGGPLETGRRCAS